MNKLYAHKHPESEWGEIWVEYCIKKWENMKLWLDLCIKM